MSVRIDGDHSGGDNLRYDSSRIPSLDGVDSSIGLRFYPLLSFDGGDNASPAWIFSKGSSLGLDGRNGATDGVLRSTGGGSIVGTRNIAPDMWHTAVITREWDGSQLISNLYVDGALEFAASGAMTSDSSDLLIGNRNTTDGIDGFVGHFCIWDTVLTTAQIAQFQTDDPRSVSPGNMTFYAPMESHIILSGAISGISKADPGQVDCFLPHGIPSGEQIFISGVSGMGEVNGGVFAVSGVDSDSFLLDVDTSSFGTYTSGGIWHHLNSEGKDYIGGSSPTTQRAILSTGTIINTRTDDTDAVIGIGNTEHKQHSIVGGDIVDLIWSSGSRTNVLVASINVPSNTIRVEGGSGNALPAESGSIEVQSTKIKWSAEHPLDMNLLNVGLGKCSSDGSNASQTFFCKSPGAGKFNIELDTDINFGSVDFSVSSVSGLVFATDFTDALTFPSLSFDTLYYWRASFEPTGGTSGIVIDASGSFTSLPDGTAPSSVTFVAGSCSRYDSSSLPYKRSELNVMTNMLTQNADFFIHLGDVIYSETGFGQGVALEYAQTNNSRVEYIRRFSEQFQFQRPFKNVLENIPTFFMFDDHELQDDFDGWWSRILLIGGNGDIPWGPGFRWVNTTGSEYKCEALGGGDPGFAGKPTTFFGGSASPTPNPFTEGTLGSLNASEWAWDGQTVHVRLPLGGDPDLYTRKLGSAGSELKPAVPHIRAYTQAYTALNNMLFTANPTPYNDPLSVADSMHYTFDIGPKVTFFAMDARNGRDPHSPTATFFFDPSIVDGLKYSFGRGASFLGPQERADRLIPVYTPRKLE